MKTYEKAIRDAIPAIIRAEGKQCVVKQVSDVEFLRYMESKLFEELHEYSETKSTEELADLLEVIYRVAELRQTGRDELEMIRKKKCEERGGGFKENLILVSAEE
ncbi:nucleoside triphosphate pyrophosphohydrolase [Methanogenium cariaci]|uniref:nucleoside triphosphate pyrophosphohydrolase n=1 Tax=Methanogenium cariaci TaxID=2197 RepID=UPI000782DEF8|nr:nucleoside triphosphate pyrophosphohydrolase [Methanogenium cariaci]